MKYVMILTLWILTAVLLLDRLNRDSIVQDLPQIALISVEIDLSTHLKLVMTVIRSQEMDVHQLVSKKRDLGAWLKEPNVSLFAEME